MQAHGANGHRLIACLAGVPFHTSHLRKRSICWFCKAVSEAKAVHWLLHTDSTSEHSVQ